jgi:crotonobetainyl-CoA:carnitine CoA-transferase CaiB-like acyl-CoA transferase
MPLKGLRVLELGHFIAAPFATRIMADLGAEIIKIEPPGEGDPARGWGLAIDGNSIWWSVHGRGKASVTVDLKSAEGREIILSLVEQVDAIVENFRPGQLERWGLGPVDIAARNPRCILVRVSGYGQDGPYRDKVAFGVIGEAMGGIRHLTAYPPGVSDLPPVRTGVSLADSVAAIYAAFGLMTAVYERDVVGTGKGRVVDVALYESIFSLMEGCLPEFGKLGIVRQPTGSTLPTNAPSNAYPTSDGKWIIIAGNSDRIFVRLMELIGRKDLANDPRMTSNWGRVEHAVELDTAIGSWTRQHTAAKVQDLLTENEIPGAPIYTIADCVSDPQYAARGMVREVADPVHGQLLHPGVLPRFDGVAADPPAPGPALGADTERVLSSMCGYSAETIKALKAKGVI